MYWDKILMEVINKNAVKEPPKPELAKAEKVGRAITKRRLHVKKKLFASKIYTLGPKYDGIYFTHREAECMLLILKGRTVDKTADALRLSPRTIEYYLKNMKLKLGCRTKFELVERVLESDFLQVVDFAQ